MLNHFVHIQDFGIVTTIAAEHLLDQLGEVDPVLPLAVALGILGLVIGISVILARRTLAISLGVGLVFSFTVIATLTTGVTVGRFLIIFLALALALVRGLIVFLITLIIPLRGLLIVLVIPFVTFRIVVFRLLLGLLILLVTLLLQHFDQPKGEIAGVLSGTNARVLSQKDGFQVFAHLVGMLTEVGIEVFPNSR
ncbi:hypothetical protein D3C81_1563450 [compost metagenome]